jgi:hypothetical protein
MAKRLERATKRLRCTVVRKRARKNVGFFEMSFAVSHVRACALYGFGRRRAERGRTSHGNIVAQPDEDSLSGANDRIATRGGRG